MQLVEAHGGRATVLTVGPPEAEEQLRYAVSVGVDAPPCCCRSTARTGTRSARRAPSPPPCRELEAADGPFDLLLFGNESADAGGFQVGIRVAHALGRPMVNGAKAIERRRRRRARPPRGRCRPGGVRAAAAGRGRRQGGHQPAPLPDDEGPPGVEAGRRAPAPGGRRARWPAHGASATTAERASTTVILGHGPDAAPAVVDLLDELGRPDVTTVPCSSSSSTIGGAGRCGTGGADGRSSASPARLRISTR